MWLNVKKSISPCLAQRLVPKNKLDLNGSAQTTGTKVNSCFDVLKYVKTIYIFAELFKNTI